MNGTDKKIMSALRKARDGMSITEISKAIGKNRMTVARCLDRMLAERKVVMRRIATARVFRVKKYGKHTR